jgi:hypothetical protein
MLIAGWQKPPESNPNGECMEARWVKSPFSENDYDCLEARWQKSQFSNPSGCCLESRWQAGSEGTVLRMHRPADPEHRRWAGGHVEVRNSKDPDGPVVWFTPAEWRAFLLGARNGDTFDLPEAAAA